MHTVIVIAGGLGLLALFLVVGRYLDRSTAAVAHAALWFIVVWLLATGFNLSIGMRRGYSLAEELPIALLVFGVPAAIAAVIWFRLTRSA
ncbi:MAG TPA: hypothetical protein VL219_02040 [Steroidobacteraceae bacterium]|nr:hypothetical protein [Steroidobacteraceae bacterium]